MDQNQGGMQFVMVPAPMGGMPWQGMQTRDYHGNDIPARIAVAIKVLNDFSSKTMTRAAGNDISIQEISGQELLPVERETQAAACKMLTLYFQGKLGPSAWENEAESEGEPTGEYEMRACPSCGGNPATKRMCQLCEGVGRIAVERRKKG